VEIKLANSLMYLWVGQLGNSTLNSLEVAVRPGPETALFCRLDKETRWQINELTNKQIKKQAEHK